MLKHIPGFRGVFTIDTLPTKIFKNESGVINYDRLTGPGTHWVCYYNEDKSNYVEFFDSFGLPPGKEITIYLKTSGKDIIYSDNQLQSNDSVLCGYYCVHYIKERNRGKNMYTITYPNFSII